LAIGGLEWMEGIPGEVGGALANECRREWATDFWRVVSVRVLDAEGNQRR